MPCHSAHSRIFGNKRQPRRDAMRIYAFARGRSRYKQKMARKLKRNIYMYNFFFVLWRCDPTRVMDSSFWRFLDHTQRRTTVGRTPLDEWSARRTETSTWQHTTLTTDKHPCPRWDSNLRSQQASGRRPTPWTARPLGPAYISSTLYKYIWSIVPY